MPTDTAARVRVAYGVWLPAGVADEPLVRAAVLLRRLPPGAVLSGSSAARVHGLWVPPGKEPDVTVPAAGRAAATTGPQRPEVTAHRRALRPGETTVVRGLPVTGLPRTWFDLAGTLDLPDLVAAGDSALRAGATAGQLAEATDLGRGRRGVVRARQALPLLDHRSGSRPESLLRVALVTGGLPAPEVNQPVYDQHGGWLAEPDLAYPAARLAVEYQGAHHAELRTMRRDAARHMDLHRAGWQVLYYTADDVRPRAGRAGRVVRDVRDALADRAPELLTRRPGEPVTAPGAR